MRRRGLFIRAVGALILLLAVGFGVGQIFLPGLAASRLRASLQRYSTGVGVSVSATPAIELLFGHAGTVRVRIATMRSTRGPTGGLIREAGMADDLHATVNRLVIDGLTLRQVALVKHGATMRLRAFVTRASIESLFP